MAVPNILLIVLAPFYILILRQKSFKISWIKSELVLFIVLMVISFAITIIKGDISQNVDLFGRYGLVLVLYVLSFPLTELKYVKYSIIFSCITMAIYTLIFSISYIWINKSFNISVGEEIKKLLITERLYTGFFCALSFLFSFTFLKSNKKSERILNYLNLFLMFFFVLVISSRMALIIMTVILLYWFFFFNNNKKSLFSLLGVFGFVIIMFIINPNLSNRFFHSNKSKGIIENFKNWEPRLVIWSSAKEIMLNDEYSIFFGFGSESLANNKLVEKYSSHILKKDRRNYFLDKKFNPHNQYLSFLLSYGIISLMLYLMIVFISLTRKKKHFIKGGVILAIFMFGLIESFFERQMGAYLFGLFLIFITKIESERNELDSNNFFKING